MNCLHTKIFYFFQAQGVSFQKTWSNGKATDFCYRFLKLVSHICPDSCQKSISKGTKEQRKEDGRVGLGKKQPPAVSPNRIRPEGLRLARKGVSMPQGRMTAKGYGYYH